MATSKMNFKKDSTITLKKETVDGFTKKTANKGIMAECLCLAAKRSIQTGKTFYLVSNYTGWQVVTKIDSVNSLNGYIEIDKYSATKFQPVFG